MSQHPAHTRLNLPWVPVTQTGWALSQSRASAQEPDRDVDGVTE